MQSKIPKFSDVYYTSLFGAAKQFEYFFDATKTPVVTVANNWHMRAFARKYKEMQFPYFAVQRTSVAPNSTDGLPAKNTRRTGIYGGRTSTSQDNYRYHLIPVEVNLRVVYMCQTESDRLAFEQQWIYNAVGGDLKFTMETSDKGLSVPIGMIMDPNLSLPDFENDDIGEIFTLESSVRLTTYIGTVATIQSITTPRGVYVDSEGNEITELFDITRGTTSSSVRHNVDNL